MSGHGFVYLQNEAALLELALVQWTMHKLYHKGFVNVLPPEMVHPNIVRACGFQPRGTQSQVVLTLKEDISVYLMKVALLRLDRLTLCQGMENLTIPF